MLGKSSLLLDVGNSITKYTFLEAPQTASIDDSFIQSQLSQINVNTIENSALPTLLESSPQVFLCSVKANDTNDEILNIMKRASCQVHIQQTQACQFGIKNSYKTVSNMGADRWMAMLGADALANGNILVIDAGTAITCDAVINKQHVGGWIAPGLRLLRESVVQNTKRVFDFSNLVPQLAFGNDTAECVANGALAQLVGIAMQAIIQTQRQCEDFTVFITGGDRELLIQNLHQQFMSETHAGFSVFDTSKIRSHSNLVLAGLARVSICEN
uniref:type III pantothenate kinase n=1 Tax=Ningiella ruwaisensis TaxID=2364274 RepID=UPI0014453A41|nr:type III pantothenate kinase [Ningiella ruwaisensis]